MKKSTEQDITVGSSWVYVDRLALANHPTWDNMTGSIYVVELIEHLRDRLAVSTRNYKHGHRGSDHREWADDFLDTHLPRPHIDKLKLIRLYSVLSRIKGSEGISNLEVYSILDTEEI